MVNYRLPSLCCHFLIYFFIGLFCVGQNCLAQDQEQSEAAPADDQNPKEEEYSPEVVTEITGKWDKDPSVEDPEHKKIIRSILVRLEDSDVSVRLAATSELRQVAMRTDVRPLVAALKRTTVFEAQLALIEVLGNLRDEFAFDQLLLELKNGRGEAQQAAAISLGKLKLDKAVEALYAAQGQAEDIELSKSAASALALLGSPKAAQALTAAQGKMDIDAIRAAKWADLYLKGQIKSDRVDSDMAPGQRLNLFYKGTNYLFYHPHFRFRGEKPWVLVCLHDSDLDVNGAFDTCYKTARKHGLALVAPLFDNMNYPDFRTFNIRGERADTRLWEIIDHVAKTADLQAREVFLFGYGWGGEFAQRFAMVYPERMARVAFASPEMNGAEPADLYPEGIKVNPLVPNIKINPLAVAKLDMAILTGKQGDATRVAERFYESLTKLSRRNGILPRIQMRSPKKGNMSRNFAWDMAERFFFSDLEELR